MSRSENGASAATAVLPKVKASVDAAPAVSTTRRDTVDVVFDDMATPKNGGGVMPRTRTGGAADCAISGGGLVRDLGRNQLLCLVVPEPTIHPVGGGLIKMCAE